MNSSSSKFILSESNSIIAVAIASIQMSWKTRSPSTSMVWYLNRDISPDISSEPSSFEFKTNEPFASSSSCSVTIPFSSILVNLASLTVPSTDMPSIPS